MSQSLFLQEVSSSPVEVYCKAAKDLRTAFASEDLDTVSELGALLDIVTGVSIFTVEED